MKAIEVMGTVDQDGFLCLPEKIPISTGGPVRIIVLTEDDGEISESQWQKSAAVNPAFDFLKEPQEDIYSVSDGKIFRAQK